MTGFVDVQLSGDVLTVRLVAPDRLNALTAPMLDQLRLALEDAEASAEIHVVILTGTGRAFCSGADLSAAGDVGGGPDMSILASANAVVRMLTSMSTVVICGLNGLAAGVAVPIVLACDLVVARENAYLLLAFTRIGLMPDGGATALLAASIGRSRAMQLSLLAEPLSVREAQAAGLIWSVHGNGDFELAVTELGRRIASGPVAAFGLTKLAINAATVGGLDGALQREWVGQRALLASDEFGEGARAFGRETVK